MWATTGPSASYAVAASTASRIRQKSRSAGALTAGWRAYNISADKASGLGDWTDEDLATYLSTGHADGHGGSAGPMGRAKFHGTCSPGLERREYLCAEMGSG